MLCRVFHEHGSRRLGFKTQLYFMTLEKSFKISGSVCPHLFANKLLKSVLSTSKVIKNVLIHSAELWRDCMY